MQNDHRIIGHLDMDAFFAAIEERDNPRLAGLPLVVGADPLGGKGRGVVSTANYPARVYGIRSAMPISEAWRLSEQAKRQGKPGVAFFGVDMALYVECSSRIMEIVRGFGNVVEQSSVDEAYIDLSFCEDIARAKNVAESIKEKIKKQERLTASIGIGANKLIAKIASDMQKPDGLTIVGPEESEAFLEPLPIRKIPGIGPKTEALLNKQGVTIVKELKRFSLEELTTMLGKWGADLYRKVRGEDDSPLQQEYEAKSVGEQETFPHDTREFSRIHESLQAICTRVMSRFADREFKNFRTIVVTVRFHDFQTLSRSRTLNAPSASERALFFESLKLLMPLLDTRQNPSRKPIRMLGVRVEKFM